MPRGTRSAATRGCAVLARAASWVQVAAIVAILALMATTWRVLDVHRDAQFRELVARDAGFAGEIMERDLRASFEALSHFGDPWRHGAPPGEASWLRIASAQMSSMPGLRALATIRDGQVAGYATVSVSGPSEGWIAGTAERSREAIDAARETGRIILGDRVALSDGADPGVLIHVPLGADEPRVGTMMAILHAETWLRALYGIDTERPLFPTLAMSVALNGETIFASPDYETLAPRHTKPATITAGDAELTLHARPRSAYFAEHRWTLAESLAVIVGLSLSAVLGLVCLLQRARRAETEARETAADLITLNASLHAEAEVRRRAEADARKARAATARFLATMSHEVRTPLNAIIGMFQLIQAADDLPERQRRQAAMGMEAARRLHRDLSNVLDISRLDAGALRVRIEDTDLVQLVHMWRASLDAYVMRSEKHIAARVDIAPDLPSTAQVDPAALTQVVSNLMDNAVKFTEDGSVTLSVAGDGQDLCIRVADTGIGIDPERRQTIFQRFYQVEETHERRFVGTGLGLAITSDLVGLMQGEIALYDNETQGTVFEVILRGALPCNPPLPVMLSTAGQRAIRVEQRA